MGVGAGVSVGLGVAVSVGSGVGEFVGSRVGVAVGSGVGVAVSSRLGVAVGTGVAALVGCGVSAPWSSSGETSGWIGARAWRDRGDMDGAGMGTAVWPAPDAGTGVVMPGALTVDVPSALQIATNVKPIAQMAQTRSSMLAAVTGHHSEGTRRLPLQRWQNIWPASRSFLHHLHGCGGKNRLSASFICFLAICAVSSITIPFYHKPGTGATSMPNRSPTPFDRMRLEPCGPRRVDDPDLIRELSYGLLVGE
jgi:hypothetical protein